MPRPLVYGNGRLLIAFDALHQARDLFWPTVGYPNHLLGHSMRVGVWCDGEFSWCDSGDWTRELNYEKTTPIGQSLWRCWKLGLEVRVHEGVDSTAPVFVRRFSVQDLRGSTRDVQLFFTQNLILGQSDVGNTAFYNPFCDAVIHYRGPHVALCSARTSNSGIHQYATGIIGFNGLEGTWKDAEDGQLSGNPIAQGSVDSTFSVLLQVPPQGNQGVDFFLCLGCDLDSAIRLFDRSVKSGSEQILADTKKESAKWLKKSTVQNMSKLPDSVKSVFYRSLLTIRSQIDSQGAVLAANDSDILATNRATYSYCWPRDGALVSRLMSRIGYPEIADNFVRFCARSQQSLSPFLMQKYRSDGSLGASWHPWVANGEAFVPFQEDETALTLLALESCSPEVQKELWISVGVNWTQAIIDHMDKDGFPLPSWDLWEERRGIHFFTLCSIIAGLRSAANLGKLTGVSVANCELVCARLVKILQTKFLDKATGQYARMISKNEKQLTLDLTPDSALLGGLLLLRPLDRTPFLNSVETIVEKLSVNSEVGGLARYDRDYYFRKDDRYPGNPWVIATMWRARLLTDQGNLDTAKELLEKVAGWAHESGVLAEQYHPESGEPLSVSPLTWSHAEFVETVAHVLEAT